MLAIDPGKKGGYVCGGASGLMPLDSGGDIDAAALLELVLELRPTRAVVERNWVSSGGEWQHGGRMGTSGAFKYGRGIGMIEGVIRSVLPDVMYVPPQTWKLALFGRRTVSKAEAIEFARKYYQHINLQPGRCRTPQDGIADAVCLLAYAERERWAGAVGEFMEGLA